MLLKRIENQEKPRWDLGKIKNLNTLTLCSMSQVDLLSLKKHLQLVVDVKTLSILAKCTIVVRVYIIKRGH